MSGLFHDLERSSSGARVAIGDLLTAARWNVDGLIPAIAQQHDSGEVLMLAWMNRAALEETLATGRVCYWSRSRQAFWRKGETSGQQQHLVTGEGPAQDQGPIQVQGEQGEERREQGHRHGVGLGEPVPVKNRSSGRIVEGEIVAERTVAVH